MPASREMPRTLAARDDPILDQRVERGTIRASDKRERLSGGQSRGAGPGEHATHLPPVMDLRFGERR
jgi:hypothetical protein